MRTLDPEMRRFLREYTRRWRACHAQYLTATPEDKARQAAKRPLFPGATSDEEGVWDERATYRHAPIDAHQLKTPGWNRAIGPNKKKVRKQWRSQNTTN